MDGKTCFKCSRTLPVTDFYRHPQMADGFLGKCKECAKSDVRSNRSRRREQYVEYERQRQLQIDRREQQSRYQKEARGRDPERFYRYQKEARERDPEKYAARTAVGNAIRDGRLTRKPCESCGDAATEAHHDDYSKPLSVRWLCFRCHRKHHGQVVSSDLVLSLS